MSDTDPEADDTTAESHQPDAEKAEKAQNGLEAEQHGCRVHNQRQRQLV